MPFKGLHPDRVGKEATESTRRIWPKLDVFGNTYLPGDGGITTRSKGGQFVVVPAGHEWTPPVEESTPVSPPPAQGGTPADEPAPKPKKA